MEHQLSEDFIESTLRPEKWHVYASSYGMGHDKSFEVQIGGRLLRVVKNGKTIYKGNSIREAIHTYNTAYEQSKKTGRTSSIS